MPSLLGVWPEIAMMRASGFWSRIACISSMPSRCGIWMSVTTTSISCCS